MNHKKTETNISKYDGAVTCEGCKELQKVIDILTLELKWAKETPKDIGDGDWKKIRKLYNKMKERE